MSTVSNDFIKILIDREYLYSLYQPIVSIVNNSIIGLEGLSRGYQPGKKAPISPINLFKAAERERLRIDLDRLCRKKVFINYPNYNDTVLFVNIDTSILDFVQGSGNIINMIKDFNLDPKKIVLEINESKVSNNLCLENFVLSQREYGFLVALDDVGKGHSNLDRIPLIKPDIIKVDREIIRNIHQKIYKQEVFKSLVDLSKRTGTLVVAEGVETASEILTCMELGADLFQGFFFSKPTRELEPKKIKNNLNKVTKSYKISAKSRLKRKVQGQSKNREVFENTITCLENTCKEEFGQFLGKVISFDTSLQSLFILNENGVQITETICRDSFIVDSPIFKPAVKGTDHSLKEYFCSLIHMDKQRYTTESYVSLATGHRCKTISGIFQNKIDSKMYILCIDFST